VGQRFQPVRKGRELFHDEPIMVRVNDRFASLMALLFSSSDMRRLTTQAAPVRDLAPLVPPAGVVLSLLLLEAQVLPQLATSCLVGINVMVKGSIADWQLASNLLRTPLHTRPIGGVLAHPGGYRSHVSALLRSFDRQLTGLLGPIACAHAVA